MNLFNYFRSIVVQSLKEMSEGGEIPPGLDFSKITVEPPRDASHGDISTNAAMVLAKPAGMKPRDIAEILVERLDLLGDVTRAEVAGPGFINMTLSDEFWGKRLADVLEAGTAYGTGTAGEGVQVNVEYVSANPTGPMHVGHGRGAVVGDALASVLEKAGYSVTREYYINDAGAQVDTLARSLHLRYREALGEDIGEIPEGLYPGDYLVPAGQALAERDGDVWLKVSEEEWLSEIRSFAISAMLDLIRDDLKALGVCHDVFSSERALVDAGAVDEAFSYLQDKGLIYTGVLEPPKGKKPDDWEPRPQTLFRATEFGDDVDRPLKKSDGTWTYFANDMAYHRDKYRRGFTSLINVWGADHGGYVKRMEAGVKALTDGAATIDVKLCQMVNLLEAGEPVKMSKRAGTFITLRSVIDKVGKDVARFIMLTRKNDAQLDFDLAKVLEQSKDNPVFYVQYAHARIHSVLRHASEQFPGIGQDGHELAKARLDRLTDPAELGLIKQMSVWPRIVESAAEAHEPHRVAFFLNDLASHFHALWNKGKDDTSLRFLVEGDEELTRARLALLRGAGTVIASGLDVLGVKPVEEMR
ncbi:MAG: arginine--tRNA ligase [Rhodospirillales bacterium]|nr:arginine--tRNA ligase [Rhodospirillales bacterium]MCW8862668.1 arginine--tRNA ligase [Rhodospirillales bacterium]MCW9001490.1 arginine--tRNA ligase [Rhodospirillales bacterium]